MAGHVYLLQLKAEFLGWVWVRGHSQRVSRLWPTFPPKISISKEWKISLDKQRMKNMVRHSWHVRWLWSEFKLNWETLPPTEIYSSGGSRIVSDQCTDVQDPPLQTFSLVSKNNLLNYRGLSETPCTSVPDQEGEGAQGMCSQSQSSFFIFMQFFWENLAE